MVYFNQMIFPYQMQFAPMPYYDMEQQRARWNDYISVCSHFIGKIIDNQLWNEQERFFIHTIKEICFNSMKR